MCNELSCITQANKQAKCCSGLVELSPNDITFSSPMYLRTNIQMSV